MRRTYERQCPHCAHRVIWPDTPTYPFCSERCRLIDLGAWASEDYRIAGDPVPEEVEGFGYPDPEMDVEADGDERL